MSSQERIRLTSDWRGYQNGETITVNKIVAAAIVEHSIGVYANPNKPKKKLKNIKEATKTRMVDSASIISK